MIYLGDFLTTLVTKKNIKGIDRQEKDKKLISLSN